MNSSELSVTQATVGFHSTHPFACLPLTSQSHPPSPLPPIFVCFCCPNGVLLLSLWHPERHEISFGSVAVVYHRFPFHLYMSLQCHPPLGVKHYPSVVFVLVRGFMLQN